MRSYTNQVVQLLELARGSYLSDKEIREIHGIHYD